ncbi:hypothetical protein, partial [Escherichia coli]
ADRNRSHWSTSKTPSYTKSVSWQHHHDWLSIKGNLSDAKMIDRHVARYGVSLVLEKAELVFSEYYSIPQISSKGKICGYVLKHKSKLDELLVREKETQ